jgi:acetamidase/formamidase
VTGHRLDDRSPHPFWDNSLPPRLTIEPGERATRYRIEHLVAEHALTPEQAYYLCGATVDLKIREIVDEPNWIVSAYLPLSIFA